MYYAIILVIGALAYALREIRKKDDAYASLCKEYHEFIISQKAWYEDYENWKARASKWESDYFAKMASLKKKNTTLKGQVTKLKKNSDPEEMKRLREMADQRHKEAERFELQSKVANTLCAKRDAELKELKKKLEALGGK